MKRCSKLILGGLFCLPMLFSGCGNIDNALEEIINGSGGSSTVTSISLNETTLNMNVGGDDVTLTATIKPDNATEKTVTWSSDKESVATVNNGVVHAVAEGSATITAKAGDKSATCTVTVADVYAANNYKEFEWNGTEKKVVFTKKSVDNPTVVANSNVNVTWNDGWYTVSGNITIDGNVTLGADTHIILCDGATLTVNGVIDGTDDYYKLYIYAQNGQNEDIGKLIVNHSDDYGYAVGRMDVLEIHGGIITLQTSYAMGTGIYIASINVYGGKLTAEATFFGGGIYTNDKSINVYGGELTAKGKSYDYAINLGTGLLSAYGGFVTALCPYTSGKAIIGSFNVEEGLGYNTFCYVGSDYDFNESGSGPVYNVTNNDQKIAIYPK